MHKLLSVCLSIVFLFSLSCNNKNFKETESGLLYKIVESGGGAKVVENGGVVMSFSFHKVDSADNMEFITGQDSSKLKISKLDSSAFIIDKKVNELFFLLASGDSAEAKFLVKDFEMNGQPLPEAFKNTSHIIYRVRIHEVLTPEQFSEDVKQERLNITMGINQTAEMLKTTNMEQYAKDSVVIEEYLSKNNLKADVRLGSGMVISYKDMGEGDLLSGSDEVKIHYEGKLTNNTVFDESYSRGEPIGLMIGQRSVIPGWEQGLLNCRKGTKATFLIPSYLAYGPNGIPKSDPVTRQPIEGEYVIPANSVLIFNIEVDEVKINN